MDTLIYVVALGQKIFCEDTLNYWSFKLLALATSRSA